MSDHIAMYITMPEFVRIGVRLAALLAMGASVAACGAFNDASRSFASSITPYKVEVVQGNFISAEQARALQKGMTRTQVRDILGSPLLASMFHADRWDYVFTIRRKGVDLPPKRLAVFFKDGVFVRSEGDEMPSETEFVKTIDSTRKLGKVPPLSASAEQLAKVARPADTTDAAPPPPPLPRNKTYPPLEP